MPQQLQAADGVTCSSFAASGAIPTGTAGLFSSGTMSYSDSGLFASAQAAVAGYAQKILQNTSAAAAASTDIVMSNNLGTASAYYLNIGINSSAFTGAGSLNLPNACYVTSTTGDLVIGTTTANAIHFVTNGGTTDAMTIATTGQTLFQASTTAAASINIPPGTAPTTPANGDMWATTTGVYARVAGATVGPFGGGGVPATKVIVFTASGTYTPTTGAISVTFDAVGGGGAGGAGRKAAASENGYGGGGGGPGARSTATFAPSLFAGGVAITVGAGGVGGTPATASSTNGGAGGNGGASSVGAFLIATGGNGGNAGGTASAAGGAAQPGMNAGQAGGASGVAAAADTASLAPTPGGGGGYFTTGQTAAFAGGNGGQNIIVDAVQSAGGAVGGSPPALTDRPTNDSRSGRGGGGSAATVTAGSMPGAQGMAPGGGGGGSGSAPNALTTIPNAGPTGAGGNGGQGRVTVTEYY